MNLSDIVSRLDELAPPVLAEKWDNVGLLLGDPSAKGIKGAVLSDDLTAEAVEAAVSEGLGLILTHHPPIFPRQRGIHQILTTSPDALGSLMMRCLQSGIAVYSSHTNFDRAALEVPHGICEGLQLEAQGRLYESSEEMRRNPGLVSGGYGVFGRFQEKLAFSEVARRVTNLFDLDGYFLTTLGPLPDKIQRLAFVAGKGSAFLKAAREMGCELFITGESDYHECLDAARNGMAVIELGHRESELFFLKTAQNWIQGMGLTGKISHSRVQKLVKGEKNE